MSTKKSPFEALAALRDALPPGPEAPATPAAEDRAPGAEAFAGKVVITRTRKGRGGRTVTTIEGITLRGEALEALARELAKALGCGTSVEGERILVQGEQQPRVRAFLEARGARRIVVGS